MEASQSTLQARLTELETKSSAVVPSEATEPAVTAEVAPTIGVTSKAAEEPAAPTPAAVEETPTPAPVEDAPAPAVAEEKPAEEKSEETKGNPFTNLCIFLFLIQLSVAAEEPMETEAKDVAPPVTEPSDAAAATTEPKPAAEDTPAAEAPAAAEPEKTE